MQTILPQLWMLADIALAGLLAGVVGLERENRDKPAGLRTNMIVGSATCLFVSISPALIAFVQDQASPDMVDTDPTRILQALLVGISFLGAGTIFKGKDSATIRYLTTAATLFYSVGIGMAVALDLYALAVGLSLLILLVNYIMRRIDLFLARKNRDG